MWNNTAEYVQKLVFGDIADNVLSFLEEVDSFHPDISNFAEGIISDRSDFSLFLKQLIDVAHYVSLHNYDRINLNILFKKYVKENKINIKALNAPSKTGIGVRFISNNLLKTEVRKRKVFQKVFLDILLNKGMSIWGSVPNNFDMFVAGSQDYLKEVEKAEQKIAKFQVLGLAKIANEIAESVDVFKKQFGDSYLNFNRLKMSTASLILAKYNNCILNDVKAIVGNGLPFQCYAVPYNEIDQLKFNKTKNTIDALENSKSSFDYYIVLVPYFGTDNIAGVEDLSIKNGVVLGERDNICYFIGMLE